MRRQGRRLGDGIRRLRTTGSHPLLTDLRLLLIPSPREPILTADESHLFRPTASDILIFFPPLSPRPSTRLKIDGTIKGLFLSNPGAFPSGSTSSKPLPAHSEPALAVWVGERKAAPATFALYPLSSLLGKGGSQEKTENRDMPMTMARKAFYLADKLSVKWNAAGTMASVVQTTYSRGSVHRWVCTESRPRHYS
jgi:hypothetical protein